MLALKNMDARYYQTAAEVNTPLGTTNQTHFLTNTGNEGFKKMKYI